MDVSPRALRAVTFREKLRGYHPDDVDQFLERVAEGVAALQGKLDAALARAEKAEVERSALTEGEDAVQRTLVLAQRTADLALNEAKEEAARLVADAQATADRLASKAQQQLRLDLERLETARKQLHDDVLAMQQYVENERGRVRTALAELVRKVDSTTRRPPPPPAPTKLDVPPAVIPRVLEPEADRAPAVEPVREPPPVELPDVPKAPPAPDAEVELAPAVPEPAPPRIRREPQPPPVSGTPFGTARPAARPSGPPPGPRRFVLAEAPTDGVAEAEDESVRERDDPSGLRRLFGR